MKNVLILTSRCFEDAYANGICAKEIRESLKKNNQINKAFIVGYTSKKGHDEFCDSETFKFTYNSTKNNNRINTIKKIFKPYIRKELIEKYIEISKKIITSNDIDAVIAMFFPLETVIACAKLKKLFPHLLTFSYQFDSATDVGVYSSKLSPLHIKAYERYLNKLYTNIDYIIGMESNRKDIQQRYSKYVNKISYVNSLALYDYKGSEKGDDETIDFLYTGTLDKDNYSPKPFFDMFLQNQDKTNWRLHFFSRGNCEEYIKSMAEKDERIIQHGYIDNSVLNEYLRKADFLLSTDNILKPNCVPYKILNYFSFGKPIIHFTKINGFTVENYINKYPLAICIDQEKMPIENNRILKFIDTCKGKTIDKDYIFLAFYKDTPDYSSDIIIQLMSRSK